MKQDHQQHNQPRRLLVCTQAVDREHPILGFFVSWLGAFADEFDRIDVICLEKGKYDLPEHVHVHSLGKESGASRLLMLARFYRHFYRIFLGQGVNYVFFHMGAIYNVLAAPFFLVRRVKGTKFYWWKTHGHINWLGRLGLVFVDRVFTASEQSFPIGSKKRVVVGHAIDIEQFSTSSAQRPPVILVVGRVMPRKQTKEAILVFKKVSEKYPEATLRIIGPQPDASYLSLLQDLISELGLETQVSFVGPLPQPLLAGEYRNASVLINTSRTDSIDKVVLEAMVAGVIPVTSTKSFEEMLARHDLFFDTTDREGMADRIIDLLEEKDDEETLRMELINEVKQNHSLATLSARLFGI